MNKHQRCVALLAAGAILLLVSCTGLQMQIESQKVHPSTDVYDGWRLGVQAWTFNRFTFYEAVDKTASLGLGLIEAYPGQRLSKDRPGAKLIHTMPSELRAEVKQKLKAAGVKVVNYGVVGLPDDEAECRKVFDFAKDMGIETIVSEPPEKAFELIDRLCKEYQINVAIHNHPKPSRYWNPDTVLKACKGRSKRIGACADTGHWVRSGLDPLECLKKLKGRIISLHFKEVDNGEEVIWGKGRGRAKGLLEELNRQKFKGVFSIEYETNWDNSVPDIRQCVAYYNKTVGGLKPTGWRDLAAKDLSNFTFKKDSWAMEDGALALQGGGDIWTKEKFGDFVLDTEFKIAKGANSGIFIRAGDHNWLPWIEVQVVDSYGRKIGRHITGAIFDCAAPTRNTAKKTGEWNHITIKAQGSYVSVVLNGEQIIDINLDDWPEAHKNPDGTKNKFDIAYKDLPRKGFIGLQDHGSKVWYRNIKIKEL